MKHTFHVFPAGPVGTALFVLRISAVAELITLFPPVSFLLDWPMIGVGVLALALSVGFRTRLAALATVGIIVLKMLMMWPALPLPFIGPALSAAALAMIGPGAFSVDARRFGRRTVHLPQ